MAIKHQSKVIFDVGLDENRIPEKITWSADDAGISNEPAEAIMISVWNDEKKETLRMDLWTKEIFTKLFKVTNKNGILVTYSAKGIVKQALRNSGFTVKRLPGPAGKHHIVQAVKI